MTEAADAARTVVTTVDDDFAESHRVRTYLIDHAVAAMNQAGGDGRPTMRTAREHDLPPVEFRDTGAEIPAGTPAGIRDRVFDPFFTTEEPA